MTTLLMKEEGLPGRKLFLFIEEIKNKELDQK